MVLPISPKWKIKRSLLSNLRAAAKKIYPLEFIALLGVSSRSSRTLCECVILPAEYGDTHSSLHTELIPSDPLVVGSVHSHPSRSSRASSADLAAFSRLGKIHLILAYPYDEAHFSAYSASGERVFIEIVDG